MAKLFEQIREALTMFASVGTKPALIGGLAVVAHNVVRATQDVDFLLEVEAADRVHDALLSLGYRCLHRSEDAANYLRGTEGLDLLYAHRPLARRLLSQAAERDTPMGRLHVISVEGLIALKLQGYCNDPMRTRDLDDIRALIQVHHGSMDTLQLREYFALFNQLELLDELLSAYGK
jgi:predicted nucleotidyltransferase